MAAQLLERPRPVVATASVTPRQDALRVLAGRLEEWLRAEESLLCLAREGGRAPARRESHWGAMLGLYERVCLALEMSAT